MSAFDQELAIALILDGLDPAKAVVAASASRSGLRDVLAKAALSSAVKRISQFGFTKYIVEPTGPLRNIPNAKCVARQLSKIANPTRDDVLRALQHCSE